MTDRAARELSTSIARSTDGIVVRSGRTNGKPVLHLVVARKDKRAADSVTIREPWEWEFSPYNSQGTRLPTPA